MTLLGVEPQFFHQESPATTADDPVVAAPYFVFVGRRDLYKNWDRFLEAFQQVQKKLTELRLAVVGSPFTSEEMAQLQQMALQDAVVHLGTVDDPTLVLSRQLVADIFLGVVTNWNDSAVRALNPELAAADKLPDYPFIRVVDALPNTMSLLFSTALGKFSDSFAAAVPPSSAAALAAA